MHKFSKNAQLLGFLLSRVGTMGVTRLLKLLYLADLESRRLRGKPISTLRFFFYNHGPFDAAFYNALDELKSEHLVAETYVPYPNGKHERQVAVQADVPVELDSADLHILAAICDKYGRMPLADLLAEVYSSPPMRGLEKGHTVPMNLEDNTKRDEIGFDVEALIAAQQEAERGNYVTGTDFFNGLRAKIAARS